MITPPAFSLPTPLGEERLSLALPLDNYFCTFRVVVGRTVAGGLSACWMLIEQRPTPGAAPRPMVELGRFSGSHLDCEVWLNGWLHAMAAMLPEIPAAEERGAGWMLEHATDEVWSKNEHGPQWGEVLPPKELCERNRR